MSLRPCEGGGGVPRFHFNVFDGRGWPDIEGSELASLAEAREEAVRLAGAIVKDDADRIAVGEPWRMEVTDRQGHLQLRLEFTVV